MSVEEIKVLAPAVIGAITGSVFTLMCTLISQFCDKVHERKTIRKALIEECDNQQELLKHFQEEYQDIGAVNSKRRMSLALFEMSADVHARRLGDAQLVRALSHFITDARALNRILDEYCMLSVPQKKNFEEHYYQGKIREDVRNNIELCIKSLSNVRSLL